MTAATSYEPLVGIPYIASEDVSSVTFGPTRSRFVSIQLQSNLQHNNYYSRLFTKGNMTVFQQ